MAKHKAAPAPAAEEVDGEIEVGSLVVFQGYDEATPEEERVLEEGEVYTVVQLPEQDGDDMTGYILQAPNPEFNSKKKAHPENNPEFLEVEVFEEEIVLADAGEEEEAEEEAEEEEAPAPTKGKAKAAPAKAAPAEKASAKGKAAAAEKAPVKGKGKAEAAKPAKGKVAAKAEPEPEVTDELPDLENEDESVLALIDGAEDLVAVAQELESEVAGTEWRLGGILYHIKKDGGYQELDEKYKENGGWALFIQDYFNIDYRKAQYLLDIYVTFTQAGIENPGEVVARLGWTKASKITKPMALIGEGEIEGSVDDLIENAENNSVSDLSAIIKETFSIGGSSTPGEKKTRITLKYRYVEEEAKVVEATILAAAEKFGCKPEEALLQVLADWAGENSVKVAAAAKAPAKAAANTAEAKPAGKVGAKAAGKATAAPVAKAAPKAAGKPVAKASAKR